MGQGEISWMGSLNSDFSPSAEFHLQIVYPAGACIYNLTCLSMRQFMDLPMLYAAG